MTAVSNDEGLRWYKKETEAYKIRVVEALSKLNQDLEEYENMVKVEMDDSQHRRECDKLLEQIRVRFNVLRIWAKGQL